jgi:hypothetical protein
MVIYIRLFALFNLVNGLFMIVAPMTWYELAPGASDTGPFNVHFVRDIGIAFTAAGLGLWLSVSSVAWKSASTAIVAMTFIGGHGVLHFVEMFAHQLSLAEGLRDTALIVAPAAVAMVWLIAEVRTARGASA